MKFNQDKLQVVIAVFNLQNGGVDYMNKYYPKLLKVAPLSVAIFAAGQVGAVELMRKELPVVAGTEIYFSGGQGCTAGLIVKKTGAFNNLTEYQRAVRYIVTAEHCVSPNQEVTVGGVAGVGGQTIGKVAWKSSVSDLALIRVEPSATRYQSCFSTSAGPHCVINVRYSPRAVGKVFLTSLRTRSVTAIAVAATGVAAQNRTFCTSGAITGVNCEWTREPPPQGWQHTAGLTVGATNPHLGLQHGDSGGPVVEYPSGNIYGIVSYRQVPLESHLPFFMGYTPISQFFSEQPGYALAPP
ncbi:trypsin-like peptidase domain-containing protein [Xanthomonas citri]|uniref:trypsin-like peptidase domain-containing protein n=1 Tax=Xanthomonas citri TaxID=346 RepID=UPI0012FD7367|nr:trypsin-like peptidase domain-containing protein [Xanthomonas citri]